MNDAVPQPARGLFFQNFGVSIHHPVDRAVSDGVRADVNASLVEQADHLAIDFGIGSRVAHVRAVHFRTVLIPRLVHPSGACAAAAVHVDFGAAGKQQAVAQRTRRFRKRGNMRQSLPRGLHGGAGVPEHEDALIQLVLAE